MVLNTTVDHYSMEKLCRLCSEEAINGFDLFNESGGNSLIDIINKYISMKILKEDLLPKQICSMCHIGMMSTVEFLEKISTGQQRLKAKINHEDLSVDKEGSKLNLVCQVPSDQSIGSTGIAIKRKRGRPRKNIIETISPRESQKYTPLDVLLDNIDNEMSVHSLIGMSDTHTNSSNENKVNLNFQDVRSSPEPRLTDEMVNEVSGSVRELIKRKRGRPRKIIIAKIEKTMESKLSLSLEEQSRPKRNTSVPSRFHDSISGKEFEQAFIKYEPGYDSSLINKEIEKQNITFSEFNFDSTQQQRTHILEGTTVVVTANHTDEAQATLPATVNIELNFNESESKSTGNGAMDCVPTASVSAVQMMPRVSFKPLESSPEELDIPILIPKRRSFGRKKKMFHCEFCNKEFLHKMRYITHVKLHKYVVLVCEFCSREFASKDSLETHQKETDHHGHGIAEFPVVDEESRRFKCKFCINRSFSSIDIFHKHVRSVHAGDKPYTCSLCSKPFRSRQAVNLHYQSHLRLSRRPQLVCKFCQKKFYHKSSLEYHLEVSHGSNRFICTTCGTAFKAKMLLQRHQLVHSEHRPHQCKICSKAFKTRTATQSHMATHSDVKKFTCEKCGKQFSHLASLNLHLMVHAGEKPFQCGYCAKKFSQAGNLKEHTRIHTGEKPFCCSICGKKFTTSSQIKFHEKRHKNEYKFHCMVCSKGFYLREVWMAHEAKHKGDKKPHKCLLCPKSFAEKASYNKHVHIHQTDPLQIVPFDKPLKIDNINKYRCSSCNKNFANSCQYIKHMIRHPENKNLVLNIENKNLDIFCGAKAKSPFRENKKCTSEKLSENTSDKNFVTGNEVFVAKEQLLIDSSAASRQSEVVYVVKTEDEQNLDYIEYITFGNEMFDTANAVSNLPGNFICEVRVPGSNYEAP